MLASVDVMTRGVENPQELLLGLSLTDRQTGWRIDIEGFGYKAQRVGGGCAGYYRIIPLLNGTCYLHTFTPYMTDLYFIQ